MKNDKMFVLCILLCVLSPIYAQQYKLYSSDDRVYRKINGAWEPVFHDETLLDRNSIVKTNAPFTIVEQWKKSNVIDCPPSIEGQSLNSLIGMGHVRKGVVASTSTKKGEDLYSNINEVDLPSAESVKFHSLLIGVNKFSDNHWEELPSPASNINRLNKAINDKMIPENRYMCANNKVLLGVDGTTLSSIANSLNEQSDSIMDKETNLVLIYISSHGVKDKDGVFHFVTSDTQYDTKTSTVTNSLSSDSLIMFINKMTAKGAEVLVFVDACYSGSIIENSKKINGSCVFFMSAENDLIANDAVSNGSPFLRALTKSISGEEEIFFRDDAYNVVTPLKLQDYLSAMVQKEYSKQRPVSKRFHFDKDKKLWSKKSSWSQHIDSLEYLVKFGNTGAMVNLGDIYISKLQTALYNIETDTAKALNYYQYAHEWGDSMAACRLGSYYYHFTPKPDYVKAFSLFNESAEAGCDLGKYYLAVCYYKGHGVEENKKISRKIIKGIHTMNWDIKQAFLEENVPITVFVNHERHTLYNNDGIVHDLVSAVSDPEYDRKHNPKRYVASVEFNAQLGKARSQAFLGQIYMNGFYEMEVNYEKAKYWYGEAANQGYGLGFFGLGVIYYMGYGENRDMPKALDFFQKAIEKKVYRACAFEGDMYYKGGGGIDQDKRHAVSLWKKGSDKKDIVCMYKYGLCLKDGAFVRKDEKEAYKLFLSSAKKGYPMAQYMAGVCLYNGIGTKQDTRSALKWLEKANSNGVTKAKEFIEKRYYVDGTAK